MAATYCDASLCLISPISSIIDRIVPSGVQQLRARMLGYSQRLASL